MSSNSSNKNKKTSTKNTVNKGKTNKSTNKKTTETIKAENITNEVEKKASRDDKEKNTKSTKAKSVPEKNKNIDFTTRIRIDRDRLNDTGTLDTSFLEKKNENINKRKILVEEEKMRQEEERLRKKKAKMSFIKNLIFILICFAVLAYGYFVIDKYSSKKCPKEKVQTKTETVEVEKIVLDDNYLFLGDFLTEDYDLDENFKDMFVVKSTKEDGKIDDFLSDMNDLVYKYNPSKIFIEVGLNDILDDEDEKEIVSKIEKIINEIKENRSYCEIYLESIYPINNDKGKKLLENANEKSKKVNVELQELAKDKEITYIDMFSLLADEDDSLKEDYTEDGKGLNDDGYEVITKELEKYVEEDA